MVVFKAKKYVFIAGVKLGLFFVNILLGYLQL